MGPKNNFVLVQWGQLQTKIKRDQKREKKNPTATCKEPAAKRRTWEKSRVLSMPPPHTPPPKG